MTGSELLVPLIWMPTLTVLTLLTLRGLKEEELIRKVESGESDTVEEVTLLDDLFQCRDFVCGGHYQIDDAIAAGGETTTTTNNSTLSCSSDSDEGVIAVAGAAQTQKNRLWTDSS